MADQVEYDGLSAFLRPLLNTSNVLTVRVIGGDALKGTLKYIYADSIQLQFADVSIFIRKEAIASISAES